ncbi:MAG: DUF3047 domain-containing protein [Candidatus Omnitrophica bacterium]|nr:DUF3047 domain-containing protein [Candidatus Omnitrophota bacterium]
MKKRYVIAVLTLGAVFIAVYAAIESGILKDFIGRRTAKEGISVIKHFPFSDNSALREWDEKVFHKSVEYKIESEGGESYIHAVSSGSCSAMYYKLDMESYAKPVLSWKWKVIDFPSKKGYDDLLNKEEDDFAARMYVIFPALFFSKSRVLEYVWARDLEVGTISSSPYSDNIKLIVAQSGHLNEAGKWVTEERDIIDDYVTAFGEKPKLKIGAIAFMCDSDSTSSKAEASFDDIKLFYLHEDNELIELKK